MFLWKAKRYGLPKSMGELFGVTKKTITEQLLNIFGTNELQKEAIVWNFQTV